MYTFPFASVTVLHWVFFYSVLLSPFHSPTPSLCLSDAILSNESDAFLKHTVAQSSGRFCEPFSDTLKQKLKKKNHLITFGKIMLVLAITQCK